MEAVASLVGALAFEAQKAYMSNDIAGINLEERMVVMPGTGSLLCPAKTSDTALLPS